MDVTLVRAAGGLVLREGPRGSEVVLVHRSAYADWSFPKGKLERGEDEMRAALREVEEETGLACKAQDDLGAITYVDARGRLKVVRYWRMHAPEDGTPVASHEIDDARWFALSKAEGKLTYHHDRVLLRRAQGADGSGPVTPVFLIRHVKAGERNSKAPDPDDLRPVSKSGLKQARAIAEMLHATPVTRLVSSPFLRCIQTLEPIAEERGLDITLARELAETQPWAGAEAWVLAVAADGPAVLSTHGDVLQGLIEDLGSRGVPVGGDGHGGYAKAGTWRLDVRDGQVREMTYLPPPR